jgi:membrane protease subunit HflK
LAALAEVKVLARVAILSGAAPANGRRIVGIVAAAAVIIWAASGFYTIKEAERGVVTRFGKFSHLVEPGLNWKPTFIDNVRR